MRSGRGRILAELQELPRHNLHAAASGVTRPIGWGYAVHGAGTVTDRTSQMF